VAAEATEINAATALLCVLGHPVRHSLSPRIHNAAFRHQNLDMVYLAFDVEDGRLPAAFEALRLLGARGANLTIPHKEAALPLLDEVDPPAARIGAVNTIVNDQGRLTGYNTDVSGFAAALRLVRPQGARGLRCLVLGAGGAARAVLAALVDGGAERVWVCNRTHERAVALCTAATEWGKVPCEAIAPEAAAEVLPGVELVVNATSLGLVDPVKDFAIDVDTLHSGHIVMDLVYGVGSTALVESARARGACAVDGKEMLVMQAADSYRLWTGREPPVAVMRAGVEQWER
jgi:shikimate dehydrogenase